MSLEIILNMAGRTVALIVFYDKDNRILLQDRTGKAKHGEEWGFFGGGIEQGETPEQAVVRETEEELGYKLTKFKYIGEYKNTLPNGFIIERHIFVSSLKDQFSKFVQKEGAGMQLFSIKEAKKLKMISGDYQTLDMIAKYLDVVGN